MKVLEQAAKECGGFYEKGRAADRFGGPVPEVVKLEDWKRLRAALAQTG
jgi:hypothetical protein